ncbi:MAG: GNAT family N-acetyltransferase [Phycisphaerales bacterium]
MIDVDPTWQPTLCGERLELRPVRPSDHDALYAVASDPLIWDQHPERDRYRREVFDRYFQGAIDSGGGLVAVDRASGRIVGASRYYDWDPEARCVAIGFTFLERALWGTSANREMKRLMLAHAFRWADSAIFHVGPDNRRSRRAMEKLGAEFVGEETTIVDGARKSRVVYRIRRESFPAAGSETEER